MFNVIRDNSSNGSVKDLDVLTDSQLLLRNLYEERFLNDDIIIVVHHGLVI